MSGDKITTPAPYMPPGQQQAGGDYSTITGGLVNQIAAGQTPGQVFWPDIQAGVSNTINNPYQSTLLNSATSGAAAGPQLQQGGLAALMALDPASQQTLDAGFDPQQALFNRTQGQVLDQTNVANAMSGVNNTPYGASVDANALGNFDINWQNNQLARMVQALSGAGSGFQSGLQTGTSGVNAGIQAGAAPYGAFNTSQANDLNALTTGTSTGNAGYQPTYSTLDALMNYLNLGQGASKNASAVNAQNLANTGSIFSGVGQTIGSIPGTVADFAAMPGS